VRKYIFDATLNAIHEHNANVPPEEIEAAVEESPCLGAEIEALTVLVPTVTPTPNSIH
jgi:hypothetical protein